MPTTPPRPLRARNAEEKKNRRQEILRAAERLWQDTPYQQLSMNQVAREAQLAKGTLYLYFDTKEELFLALLTGHLQSGLQELSDYLKERPVNSAQECAELFMQTLEQQESLLKLLILWNTTIQVGVTQTVRHEFQLQMLRMALPLLEQLPFSRRDNLRLLLHVYALGLGWHMVIQGHPAEPKQALLSQIGSGAPDDRQEFKLACRAVVHAVTQGEETPFA